MFFMEQIINWIVFEARASINLNHQIPVCQTEWKWATRTMKLSLLTIFINHIWQFQLALQKDLHSCIWLKYFYFNKTFFLIECLDNLLQNGAKSQHPLLIYTYHVKLFPVKTTTQHLNQKLNQKAKYSK